MQWLTAICALSLIGGCSFDPSASDGADAGAVDRLCPNGNPNTLALFTFDDESRLAADATGDHDGILRGDPMVQVGGPCGAGIQFPSTASADTYIEIPDSPDWDLSEGSFSFWMKPTSSGVGVVSRDASQQLTSGHTQVQVDTDLKVFLRVQDTLEDYFVCSDGPIALDTWIHVGVNLGPPAVELYIDGELGTNSVDLVAGDVRFQCGDETSRGIAGNNNPWVLGASNARSDDGAADPISAPMRGGAIDHLLISSERTDFSFAKPDNGLGTAEPAP